jgi:hypothetical protein
LQSNHKCSQLSAVIRTVVDSATNSANFLIEVTTHLFHIPPLQLELFEPFPTFTNGNTLIVRQSFGKCKKQIGPIEKIPRWHSAAFRTGWRWSDGKY